MSSLLDPDSLSGYRRRIVIDPGASSVQAELEDDFHRMVVTLFHDGGNITGIESEMKRSPWTTCEGAMAQLEKTFLGKPLDDPSFRTDKPLNCTHLYDLATFCALHAAMSERAVYDIAISDPTEEGRSASRLYRNGEVLLDWLLQDGKFVVPQEIEGKGILEIGEWLASLDDDLEEAARILRWATMISGGRSISMPAGMSGAKFAIGATCYTFQPDMAEKARRKPGADLDFSGEDMQAMADRAELFKRA
ncbi:MAG: DUF2889 domain-containing protein [Sphingomonadaceae bacterium]|nr:DUF2889 domain-containing protein [Sphingomonadaceae bacterium]